jgi:hypothetical protein
VLHAEERKRLREQQGKAAAGEDDGDEDDKKAEKKTNPEGADVTDEPTNAPHPIKPVPSTTSWVTSVNGTAVPTPTRIKPLVSYQQSRERRLSACKRKHGLPLLHQFHDYFGRREQIVQTNRDREQIVQTNRDRALPADAQMNNSKNESNQFVEGDTVAVGAVGAAEAREETNEEASSRDAPEAKKGRVSKDDGEAGGENGGENGGDAALAVALKDAKVVVAPDRGDAAHGGESTGSTEEQKPSAEEASVVIDIDAQELETQSEVQEVGLVSPLMKEILPEVKKGKEGGEGGEGGEADLSKDEQQQEKGEGTKGDAKKGELGEGEEKQQDALEEAEVQEAQADADNTITEKVTEGSGKGEGSKGGDWDSKETLKEANEEAKDGVKDGVKEETKKEEARELATERAMDGAKRGAKEAAKKGVFRTVDAAVHRSMAVIQETHRKVVSKKTTLTQQLEPSLWPPENKVRN